MPGKEHEQLVTDLGAAVGLLMRRLRAESPGDGITPTQRAVCARLDLEGPATTAALARAELVRPQSMRVTLAALEERGVVARSPHPTDGRQVVFALTEEGREVLAGLRRAKQNWLSVAIAEHTTPDEQRVLAEAAALLKRLTET
ncbi:MULTISPECIES: MarR family winged helix-turn-helix transcriptional regulator [Streptomyces]|uniref:MarR family transcriptional regulator n=1 Tax=Streptomyces olivaceiscleroticus TaxID=68245 RepID=A0ABN1AJX0_9ACTN|nr:MarR family transcriptional regulator [Streptomyces niger]